MASKLTSSVLYGFRAFKLRSCALALCVASQVAAQPGSTAAAPNLNPGSTSKESTTEECVVAHRESQTLRRQYHLLESRDRLLQCSNTACPAVVRKDCQRWLDEVAVQISSVVVHVDTGDSAPPNNVKVYIDGDLRFESIPNRAIELDPGTYRFRFEVGGRQPVELQVTVVEAEKLKNVTVKYSPPEKEPSGLASGQDSSKKPISISLVPPKQAERPVSASTYVFAGLGGLAAINFAIWGIWTQSYKSELQSQCAPNCDQKDIDRIKTRALVADISLGVSVASLTTAAITYFARPQAKVPMDVAVGTLPNGGFMARLQYAGF